MKKFLFIFLFVFSQLSYSSCEETFKKYRLEAPLSPFRALGISVGQVGLGALSSTGGLALGTTLLNSDYAGAGVLYGTALVYEAQYGLAKAYNDIKFYNSRVKVLKVIQEAKQGFGANLQQLYHEIVPYEDRERIPLTYFTNLVSQADQDRVFCQSEETLYTMFNMKKLISRNLGI